MVEYNYFCWAEKYGDKDSFQQKRYRVFNVEISKEEYTKINQTYRKLDFDEDDDSDVRFQNAFKKMWNNLTIQEQQEYLDIPYFNWDGFTFITGVTEKDVKKESLSGKEVEVVVDGQTYKAIIK